MQEKRERAEKQVKALAVKPQLSPLETLEQQPAEPALHAKQLTNHIKPSQPTLSMKNENLTKHPIRKSDRPLIHPKTTCFGLRYNSTSRLNNYTNEVQKMPQNGPTSENFDQEVPVKKYITNGDSIETKTRKKSVVEPKKTDAQRLPKFISNPARFSENLAPTSDIKLPSLKSVAKLEKPRIIQTSGIIDRLNPNSQSSIWQRVAEEQRKAK